MIESNHKSLPEMSGDARILLGRLRTLAVGDVVTYRELSDLIGRDVQGPARGTLDTARKAAEREYGMALGTVMKQGIKRLAASELSSIGDSAFGRIGRTARTAAKRMFRAASTLEVAPPDAAAIAARASGLAAIGLMAKPSSLQKIEQAAQNGKELPTATTLRLFG